MNLDQLTIEIRPRRAWEATDLGLLMARRWWWPMMKVWLLLTLPIFLLLNLLPSHLMWLSYTLIWWLKPLFERPLLHILSQAVFNQPPDTRTTLKLFPQLAWRQLFLSLTWRRFSASRSMDLPVIQLEGLAGEERSQRLAILHREDSSPASWLTIMGVHLEPFLGIGMAMLLYALIPTEIHIDWLELVTTQEDSWFILLTNCCNYLAMSLVAPFYVACGFALYLNRRIKLEAWDIDIAFQRIINKRRPTTPKHTALGLLLILIFSGSLSQSPSVHAESLLINSADPVISEGNDSSGLPNLTEPYTRVTAKESITQIAEGDAFHQKQTLRYPTFGDHKKAKKKSEDIEEGGFWSWVFSLFKSKESMVSIASGAELIFWALVLCLIFFVVFRYRHWLAAYLPQSLPKHAIRAKPVTLFGMDITRESLPDDVSASALSFVRANNPRAAFALLYRASLSRLVEAGVVIEDGYTEDECLQAAQQDLQSSNQATQSLNNAMPYFAQLTRSWQQLAYGHITPDSPHAEQLCKQWNAIWHLSQNDLASKHVFNQPSNQTGDSAPVSTDVEVKHD